MPITNAIIMDEIVKLKARMEHVEKAVDDKNTAIVELTNRINSVETQLVSFRVGVQLSLRIGAAILALLSILVPFATLIIQHYWH